MSTCRANGCRAACAGSNTVSVAEDVVMRILVMVRNFLPAHEQIAKGEVRPRGCMQCFAKCPFTCQFDRLSNQLSQSLDRLSDHFAKHCATIPPLFPRRACWAPGRPPP